MRVREGSARHERGDDRDAGHVRQLQQRLRGVRADDPAADVEDGLTRVHDESRGLSDLLAVRARHRVVAGKGQARRPLEGRHRLEGVLGDVDEHRARASGGGDVEGLRDRARDLLGASDQETVLGDRHRDAADVSLLEGVGADERARDLTGDGHQRDGVHVGVGQRRDEVRRTRTGGRHAHADAAGGVRVALGRMAGALLVTREDVTDLRGVHQRVVQGKDRPARDTEDVGHTSRLECVHQALGTGDLLGHLLSRPSLGVQLCRGNEKPSDPGGKRRVRAGDDVSQRAR